MKDLLELSARQAVAQLRAGAVQPEDLLEACFAQIDALDGILNAIPTRTHDRALAACKRARGERKDRLADPFWLGGLPIVIKDIHPVAGVRTTFGSRTFADYVPAFSAWHVDVLERQGAIVIGKSNTPEFAAGAQTFNEVFGVTRNPWNTDLTCGGSSGGSAVAVAARMAWLADGSDLGGSLRIPAAFCGVVGLRPTPGRVPNGPQKLPFQTLNVVGPMARDIGDLALMLDVLSTAHPNDPLSRQPASLSFSDTMRRPSGVRQVGFDPNLGGRVPVTKSIAAVLSAAASAIAMTGVGVSTVSIADDDTIDAFAPLRAQYLAAELGEIHRDHPGQLKPDLDENIRAGLAIGGAAVAEAERARGRLYDRLTGLFATHDILILPATIVEPFDVNVRFPTSVDGHPFVRYFDWAAPTFVISLSGCPALSLPCGLTTAGLPVGLQLVAPPGQEGLLLSFAREVEEIIGLGTLTSPVVSASRQATST